MEIFIAIIDFLILGLLLVIPILLLFLLGKLNTNYYSIYYFLIGLLLAGVIIYFFAWWSYQSNCFLLEYYGYNINGLNETELFEKVLPENKERVINIEKSIMGIGWTLKAIFGFVVFFPYLCLISIINRFLEKSKI
jgi:hypothetical protein